MIEIKDKNGLVIFSQNTFTYTGNFMGERSISCSVQSPAVLPFEQGCYLNYRNEQFKLDKTPNPTLKKISSENSIINAFQYDLKFVSLAFELQLIAFRDVVSYDSTNYYAGTSDVEFTGTVSYLTDRIQACLDAVYFGANKWTVELEEGLITTTESIKATDISCWDALALVNSTDNWKLNFYISDRHILVGTPKNRIEKSFEYGKGNGLYELSRNVVESESIITRLRVYGSDVNIPSDYKREAGAFGRVAPDYQYLTNLMLPSYASIPNYSTHADSKGAWNNYTSYSIGDLVHYSDNKQYYCIRATGAGVIPLDSLYFTEWPSDYIDSPNINKYGIREGIFRDESIRPSITGVTIADLERNGVINSKTGSNSLINEILAVSKIPVDVSGSTSNQSYFYAWVRNIGFDIQSSILNGNTAKLELIDSPVGIQGFDFEITSAVEDVTSYPESKYRLTLKRNSSESFIIPNSENNIYLKSDGNNLVPDGVYAHFVITGVSMPLFLTEIAENRLLESGKNYLAKHDSPLSTYSLGVDDIEMARNRTDVHESIMEGQHIGVYDSNIGCGGVIESNGNFDTNIHPRWDSSDSAIIFGVDMFNIGILPSGIRTGSFYELGASSYIWTSDMYSSDSAIAKKLSYDGSDIHSVFLNRSSGATIIPVRDVFSGEVSMEDGTVRAGVYTDSNGVKYDGVKIGDKVWLASPLIETKYKGETVADSLIFNGEEYKYFHQFIPDFQYEIGASVIKPSGIAIATPDGEISPNTDAYYYKTASLPDVWDQLIPSGCRYMGEYRSWINYVLNDIVIIGGVYYKNISPCVGVEVSDALKWKTEYGYPEVRIDRLISGLTNREWTSANYGAVAVYPYSGVFSSELEMVNNYGRLYNHYSIENPLGLIDSSSKFRIPSNSDFISLENYLKSKYQTQYSFGGSNLLKSKRQVNSPLNGIGITIPINQYIPIQTLIIKEGFSQIPSYEITLSNEPISSTLNSISSAISANSTAIGHATSSLSNAIKTTGKAIESVKSIIPTSPTDTGSEPEITPKQNGILSWLNSSWVFLVDNFVRSDRKVNGKSLDADITLSTSDILDTSDKRYQTDNQKLFNDATSSIQGQIDGKQNAITTGTTSQYFRGDLSLATFPTITPQIQSDWNQSNSSFLDYIKNKPALFSGAYSDLTGKPTLFSGSYLDLTNKPTIPAAQVQTDWNATTGFGVLLNKPTQLSQFTNNLGNYGGWITGINSGMVTTALGFTPIQLAALSSSATGLTYTNTTGVFSLTSGYSIPTTANQTNWSTAYGWGNHAGLYRPISYVPAWSEITSNPFSFTSLSSGQLLKYNSTTSKFENFTPSYLSSFTETDPIFTAWNKSTGISITKSQVSDFGTYESPLTFSTGFTRTGNTITNNITQYTDVLARAAQTNTSITTALGYAPWYSGNHPTTLSGYGITDAVTGTPWTSMGYLTGITSGQVTIALGYTPKPTFTENTAFNKNFGTTAGTVLEGRTFGTAANSAVGDFIQNQNRSAQSAYMWINGSAKIDGGLALLNRYDNSNNGSIIYNSGSGADFIFAESAQNIYSFGSGSYGSIVSPTLSLNISTRAATFASTVNSTGFLLNGNNLTSSLSTNYLPKWNGSTFVNSLISDDGSSVVIDGTVLANRLRTKNNTVLQVFNGGAASSQLRWGLEREGDENGSNTGSYLRLYRYSDNGSFLNDCLTIERNTGNSIFNGSVNASQFNGSGAGLTGSSSNFSSTPLSHVHGNITNGGLIGTTANLPIITGTGGILQTGSFGNSSGTFCEGNDSRLSDSRVASDVYSWAKASTKPSYTYSEVGAQQPITLTTNGTSGAATKIGDVINIPNYAENTSGASYSCPATIEGGLSFANIYSALYSKNNNVYSVAIRGACTSDVGANTIVSFKFPTPSAITASSIVGIGIALNDYSSMPMLISTVTGNNSQLAVLFRSTGVSGTTYTFSIIVYYN